MNHVYFYEGDSKMNAGPREIQKGNIWFDLSNHLPNYMILTSKYLKKMCMATVIHLYASFYTPLNTECNYSIKHLKVKNAEIIRN